MAFSIFGGTAIWLAALRHRTSPRSGLSRGHAVPGTDALPLSQLTPVAVMVLLAIFFVTSGSSATLVIGVPCPAGRRPGPQDRGVTGASHSRASPP
ncbi:BCCT family transporter [Kocuria rhizophila]|nr:BCCT family transporter [Kocuria rhizophila]